MSTLSHRLGQFASLESEGIIGTVELEVDEGGAPLDVDNMAETAMMDASEDEAVVVDAVIENDELVETTEALEAFLDQAVYPAINDGGWNRKEAGLAQLAVESIFARIGVADFGRDMVGCENYSDHGANKSRVTSLESAIMDALRDIWRKIKEVLNKMMAFIRKWYIKLADGASRLKRRALGIKKLADTKGGTAKEKKLTDSPILKQIHLTKKAPSLSELSGSLSTVKGLLGVILSGQTASTYAETLDSYSTLIESAGDATKLQRNAAAVATKTAGGSYKLGGVFKGTATADKDRYSGFTSVQKSEQLIGGKMLVLGNKTYEIAKNEVVIVNSLIVDDFANKKLDVDKGSLDVLSPSQVASLCDTIVDILTEIVNYKLGWEKYETASKSFIQKMDKIVDGKGDEDDQAKAKIIRSVAKAGNALVKSQAEAARSAVNIGMHVSRGTLAYCSASLGQYKAA